MIKRIFFVVLLGAMFFVAMQFVSVLFYVWEFDDFTRDAVKFAPIRQDGSEDHLVGHIQEGARFYGLAIGDVKVRIDKRTETPTGVKLLAVDVAYTTPVDLYYFTYQLRGNVHAATTY